jgi:hypothetical protein
VCCSACKALTSASLSRGEGVAFELFVATPEDDQPWSAPHERRQRACMAREGSHSHQRRALIVKGEIAVGGRRGGYVPFHRANTPSCLVVLSKQSNELAYRVPAIRSPTRWSGWCMTRDLMTSIGCEPRDDTTIVSPRSDDVKRIRRARVWLVRTAAKEACEEVGPHAVLSGATRDQHSLGQVVRWKSENTDHDRSVCAHRASGELAISVHNRTLRRTRTHTHNTMTGRTAARWVSTPCTDQ